MKVVTLLGSDFSESCLLLSQKIDKEYNPDLVIGVLTGGGYVGREIFKTLSGMSGRKYAEIKIQRLSTKQKENGLLKLVLKYSPTFLLNWLRMLESVVLEKKARKHNPKRSGTIVIPSDINSFLKESPKNILLVDDAIDSGATLNLLKEYLELHYNNAAIKIAVITVTTPHPIIDADFCLYHDRVLVRFPWSNDIKKRNDAKSGSHRP